jgi:glucose-6-phosphate isomerase
MSKHSPHTSPADQLSALATHYEQAQHWQLSTLFDSDAKRFDRFSFEAAGLFLDFSKNHINDQTISLLTDWARACQLEEQRDAMFRGEAINTTEGRAVLHTALRLPSNAKCIVDGKDINQDIQSVLSRIDTFSAAIRSGSWQGYSGKRITDIVNIGIGGSDLGPAMTCAALRPFVQTDLRFHFLSNVDGHDIDAKLNNLQPETTLFIIASKTFTTQETMLNAHAARDWFLQHGSLSSLAQHFVAVSTNAKAVAAFGIDTNNMFPFWDWVGGRYSIWSGIGLPLAIAIGMQHFREFLAGAHAMDKHFQQAPLERNMPVILALIATWYRQFFQTSSQLIAPYHQDLQLFPTYLQQLEMESNGKRVTRDGKAINSPTAPIIWGSAGTNGQHAYFQLLHQGTDVIPVDFITTLKPSHTHHQQHQALLANCFAQSEALMRGKSEAEVRIDMQAQQQPEEKISALLAHKHFPGNRPSNTLLLEKLTPTLIGALIALYEHKVFVQGVLWDINSFDQWGVELGKILANRILSELEPQAEIGKHDSSTIGLIAKARQAS